MAGSTFQTNPYDLNKLLDNCHCGVIQLPDFQRSWVWDEDRIKSLIASVSRAFPVGALMSLDTGGPVNFKPRPVEGAPIEAKQVNPQSLLLDGQQRMTSLYQVTLRGKVVETVTPKKKKVKRWFYIDIRKALDPTIDREEAIVGVPEDRCVRADFGREIVLDLSTAENEYASLMYPVSHVFDWDRWQDGFDQQWRGDQNEAIREEFRVFKRQVLENFRYYRVPVISLDRTTSKEAVCVVFEKVNTAGKPLDAFELVTAMYASSGYELRKDWYGDGGTKGRHQRLAEALRPAGAETGILAGVANTDFLQAISLFYTRDRRRSAEAAGKQGKDLPAVSGNRQALLNLPLEEYRRYEVQVERGFVQAAKFLHMLHIYRIFDLPYQSQIVPLAAILADIGEAWEHEAIRAKLVRWYWNGVFGELYGSAADTRIARDFMEVPVWLNGGPEPSTVSETMFRADRLKTMRMRLSAAYKGVNALLMKEGAQDFRSGQKFDHTVFFGENVDIHHIYPQDWCKKHGINPSVYDSIINKTPLSYRTNRIIGGVAPSKYLAKLEAGDAKTPSIERDRLDAYIASHLINPSLLRADSFDEFMADRQSQLLELIERATGKAAYSGDQPEEGEDVEDDEDTPQLIPENSSRGFGTSEELIEKQSDLSVEKPKSWDPPENESTDEIVGVSSPDLQEDDGEGDEYQGNDYSKFTVRIGETTYDALPKRTAIFTIIRHLCDLGVTPEEIEECVQWRSTIFAKAEGSLDSSAFVQTVKVDSGGYRRFYCGDDQLIRCNGKTYAIANGWGKRTQEAIDNILARFPDKNVTCERSIS